MGRVLIIKFGAIGDVIMTIPAAFALHEAGSEIHWVCGLQVLPLLQQYSWIRPIAVDDRALFAGNAGERLRALVAVWRAIAGRRYDLCATLYYDRRYRVVSLPVQANRRVSLSHQDRQRSLMPGRHHSDEYLRVMLGTDDGPKTLALSPVKPEGLAESASPRAEGRNRVLLVPGGAQNNLRTDALRRWPLKSYVALAERLREEGMEVVLVGGPDDRWASESFAHLGATDQIGRLTLLETVALMEASEVLVTHDTGPLHLGGITAVSIVSIFGPTDPRGRLPQRSGTVALWGGEGFACRPCYDGRDYAPCKDNACVQQVTPEMVFVEVKDLLQQRREGKLRPPRVATPVSTVETGLEP